MLARPHVQHPSGLTSSAEPSLAQAGAPGVKFGTFCVSPPRGTWRRQRSGCSRSPDTQAGPGASSGPYPSAAPLAVTVCDSIVCRPHRFTHLPSSKHIQGRPVGGPENSAMNKLDKTPCSGD